MDSKVNILNHYNDGIKNQLKSIQILLEITNDHKNSNRDELFSTLVKRISEIFALEFVIIGIDEFQIVSNKIVDNTQLALIKSLIIDQKLDILQSMKDKNFISLTTRPPKAHYQYQVYVLDLIKNGEPVAIFFIKKFYNTSSNRKEDLVYHNFLIDLEKDESNLFSEQIKTILQLSLNTIMIK